MTSDTYTPISLPVNTATNVTHLLWADRWIEVVRVSVDIGNGPEPAWRFKSGRDAADWLLYD